MQLEKPPSAFFIRLGSKNAWAEDCLRRGVMRLGYRSVSSHQASLRGDWPTVLQHWMEVRKNARVASSDLTQIQAFYQSGEDTLFITFFDYSLFWCHPRGQVELLGDGTHERDTVDGWHRTSENWKPLDIDSLPESLRRVRGFMGTICSVKDRKQVLALIKDRSARS